MRNEGDQMRSTKLVRTTAIAAVFAIGSVAALTACSTSTGQGIGENAPTAAEAVLMNADDETVTAYQGTEIPTEDFEAATEPITDTDDPSAFEFTENYGLSEEEASERLDTIA